MQPKEIVRLLQYLRRAVSLALAAFLFCVPWAAPLILAGCTKGHSYTNVDLADLEHGKPFFGEVESIYIEDFSKEGHGLVVNIGLKTTDGERVSIGGEQSSPQLADFARTLTKGSIYEFPKAWTEYKSKRSSTQSARPDGKASIPNGREEKALSQ